jgi:hypothetical protein
LLSESILEKIDERGKDVCRYEREQSVESVIPAHQVKFVTARIETYTQVTSFCSFAALTRSFSSGDPGGGCSG